MPRAFPGYRLGMTQLVAPLPTSQHPKVEHDIYVLEQELLFANHKKGEVEQRSPQEQDSPPEEEEE